MITFIAFLLTMVACANWLSIGLLQYDFIAGLFGFQASIFSRLVYILYGVAAIYLLIRIIVNKGSVKIFERKKKKQKQPTNVSGWESSMATKPQYNSEAGKEQFFDETNHK